MTTRTLEMISRDLASAVLYVTPLGGGETESTSPPPNTYGLASYTPNAELEGSPTVYRVHGTAAEQLDSDSTLLISTAVKPKKTTITCNDETVLALQLPSDAVIPYVHMRYGSARPSDLPVGLNIEDVEFEGIVNTSGTVDTDLDIVNGTVIATLRASAKVTTKVPKFPSGYKTVTLLNTSATLKASKSLSDLTPCGDTETTVDKLRVTGRFCYEGNAVCFQDGKLYVHHGGGWMFVTNIPRICKSIP